MRRGGIVPFLVGVILAVVLIGSIAAVLYIGHGHKKDAGPVREIGSFNSSEIVVKAVVGDVRIVSANVSGVVVKSNLPIKAVPSGGSLTVYCPAKKIPGLGERSACNDYLNGMVIIEVGSKLDEVSVRKTVGDVEVKANTSKLVIEDVVGDVRADAPAGCMLTKVVGDVSIRAEGDVRMNNIVGDVRIAVPADFSVQLSVENAMGDVENDHRGTGKVIHIEVSHVIGDVRVE